MQTLLDLAQSHPSLSVLALIVGGVTAWNVWAFRLRPLLIPRAEIDATADEMIARYGPRAEEMAYIEEDRAWRCSDSRGQGRWRRVRRELWRRHRAGEWK